MQFHTTIARCHQMQSTRPERLVQIKEHLLRRLFGTGKTPLKVRNGPDMAAVLAYLRSRPAVGQVHPRPVFEEGGRRALAAGELKSSAAEVRERTRDWPPDLGPDHALARYLSRATCAECHGLDLAGRQRLGGGKPPPDLSIVGAYDAQQFERLLRTGRAAGDRELELMSGVARGRYRHFTNEELTQLYSYLREIGSSK